MVVVGGNPCGFKSKQFVHILNQHAPAQLCSSPIFITPSHIKPGIADLFVRTHTVKFETVQSFSRGRSSPSVPWECIQQPR